MLSFAEEIYLLALDDVSGKVVIPSKEVVLSSALIGAALGELSFMGKIDSDEDNLIILNTEPVNNVVLDEVLSSLRAMETESLLISEALNNLLPKASKIEDLVLKSLLEKKILQKVEERILWVIPSKRYPVIDNREIKDVESRLRELITSDEIPDPRDTVLVSLVHACGLFGEILSHKDLQRCEERIETLAKMDLVGQKVLQLIVQINNTLSTIAPFV